MMEFVASLTRSASELNTMLELWNQHGDERKPFRNIMITPLFMPKSGMKVIEKWREQDIIENLYFDSGGFYVQMGRINYLDLYTELLKLYRKQHWADWYILPDNVPTSGDSEQTTWNKVRDTAEYGRMFFHELPPQIQQKAIPVVHGFTSEQAEYSLDAATQLETGYLGFGSFSTSGKSSSINKLTASTYMLLSQIIGKVRDSGFRFHAFGVSTPPVLHILRNLNIFSFDSIGWMKTAGFGKVYMPYIRAYNITYKDKSAQTITQYEFDEMKAITGHSCYFCQSFRDLHEKRFHRIMHNLHVIMDMIYKPYNSETIEYILNRYSPAYASIIKGCQ